MLRSAPFIALLLAMTFSLSDLRAGCRRSGKQCCPNNGPVAIATCVYPCAGSAVIVLHVPKGAKVYFEDEPTVQTSATRVYSSPLLPVGRIFTYTVKVESNGGGGAKTETRYVPVQAFCTSEVDFTGSEDPESDLPTPKDVPKLPEAFFPSELPV